MNRRIFLGIKVTSGLFNNIRTFVRQNQNIPIRWSEPTNLHVTIVPPWYTEQPELEINKIKNSPNLVAEFTLSFHTIQFGPDPKKPRLLWLVGQEHEELLNLKTICEKTLGLPIKYNRFIPHVTLGRIKTFIKPEIRKIFPISVQWNEPVRSLTLFESHLSPRGARYDSLFEFPLTQTP